MRFIVNFNEELENRPNEGRKGKDNNKNWSIEKSKGDAVLLYLNEGAVELEGSAADLDQPVSRCV